MVKKLPDVVKKVTKKFKKKKSERLDKMEQESGWKKSCHHI